MMLLVAFASTSESPSRFLFFFSEVFIEPFAYYNRLHSMCWIGAPNLTFFMNEKEMNLGKNLNEFNNKRKEE